MQLLGCCEIYWCEIEAEQYGIITNVRHYCWPERAHLPGCRPLNGVSTQTHCGLHGASGGSLSLASGGFSACVCLLSCVVIFMRQRRKDAGNQEMVKGARRAMQMGVCKLVQLLDFKGAWCWSLGELQ
jgi:hypothetical protein